MTGKGPRRWEGFTIVLDPKGEPLRNVFTVLAQDARDAAVAQVGADWAELELRGYRLQPGEFWGTTP